jgi:hypothetical protein
VTDERYAVAIEKFDKLGKVREGARETINLVDDNDVYPAESDIGEKLLQGWEVR